jgi:hypothetical protein
MSPHELPAIAQHHANAITLFQQGKYCEARTTLLEVLHKLLSVCESEVAFETDVTVCSETSNNDIVLLDEEAGSNQNPEAKSDDCIMASDSFYVRPPHDDPKHDHVFTGAFTLPSGIPIGPTEISAVVLFNVAMTFLMIGTETGKSADLRHALHCYKKCYRLLEDCHLDPVMLTLMAAALYLNMAHILGVFFYAEHSRSMVAKLAELISGVNQEHSVVKIMCKEDFDFFAFALFSAEIDDFKFAPAA